MSSLLPKLFSALVGTLMLASVSVPGITDESAEHIDGIIVEDAIISTTNRGETAYLSLKITNDSGSPVTLHSIKSPVSSDTRLVVVDPIYGPQQTNDLSILRDETLNLASSHIRVELQNTNRSIVPDTIVPFELIFRRSSMLAQAHAHQICMGKYTPG